MMDIYKKIVNEIAKPICGLNQFQIQGVIEHLSQGSMESRLCGEALARLNRYINLTLQLHAELTEFAGELENESTHDESKE